MIAWPKVLPAVAALLPTVPGWAAVEVFKGPPLSDSDPQVYCTVGFVLEEDSAGTFNQEPGDVDGMRAESGEVRCELVVKDAEFPVALAQASGLLDALDAVLRDDPSLGGALDHGEFVTLGGDIAPRQSTSGGSVRVPLSVQYFCRTP